MKEIPGLADDPNPFPASDARHPALERQDRLRRVAPAVQHEINNAMMVLAANLDLLARSVGTADAPPQRQLERAVQASRRLEEVMRGFLDCARREAAEMAPLSPATVLRQMLPLLKVALGARLGVEMTAPDRLLAVPLDRAALEMALLAVAQEGVTRMPQGSQMLAEVRETAAGVELALTLPTGVGEAPLALLRGCCAWLETRADGCVLGWPKA